MRSLNQYILEYLPISKIDKVIPVDDLFNLLKTDIRNNSTAGIEEWVDDNFNKIDKSYEYDGNDIICAIGHIDNHDPQFISFLCDGKAYAWNRRYNNLINRYADESAYLQKERNMEDGVYRELYVVPQIYKDGVYDLLVNRWDELEDCVEESLVYEYLPIDKIETPINIEDLYVRGMASMDLTELENFIKTHFIKKNLNTDSFSLDNIYFSILSPKDGSGTKIIGSYYKNHAYPINLISHDILHKIGTNIDLWVEHQRYPTPTSQKITTTVYEVTDNWKDDFIEFFTGDFLKLMRTAYQYHNDY